MSVLRAIERRIEALIEGVFGRAFRAPVQPVELARKLAKEMDDHRAVSVSKTYAPNEFTLYLSRSDRAQFGAYETSMVSELQQHLADHARRERYELLASPLVVLSTDEDLAVGEFGIATRIVEHDLPLLAGGEDRAPTPGPPAPTTILSPTAVAAEVDSVRSVTVTANGVTTVIDGARLVIGRSQECDLPVDDVNVSRRHCEIIRGSDGWAVVDLGSTNGTEVNGRRIGRAPLEDGDRITVGGSELVFGVGVL